MIQNEDMSVHVLVLQAYTSCKPSGMVKWIYNYAVSCVVDPGMCIMLPRQVTSLI